MSGAYFKFFKLFSKFLKNRRHSWIGHTIGHNEFAVNIHEGAIFVGEKKGRWKTWTTILKASRQKHSS